MEALEIFALKTFLVAQTVKCLPTMWETWVQSLGREDPLEKKWQPTPVLLPGKSHGWRSMVSYSPWDHKELDTTDVTWHSIDFIPGDSEVKVSAYNVGDLGLIPGSGRSPGEGNGNALQYSCLGNPMDGGAW